MKNVIIFFTLLVLSTTFQINGYSQDMPSSTITKEGYVILSAKKFAEIEAEMNKQDDWCPILIEGYPKNELVAFYIQSYEESTILTWVDFAYKKIHSFEKIKPQPQQERKLQKSKTLPRTAENMHGFMMLMTTEQIEAIGY